jgi:hypothetical protein
MLFLSTGQNVEAAGSFEMILVHQTSCFYIPVDRINVVVM